MSRNFQDACDAPGGAHLWTDPDTYAAHIRENGIPRPRRPEGIVAYLLSDPDAFGDDVQALTMPQHPAPSSFAEYLIVWHDAAGDHSLTTWASSPDVAEARAVRVADLRETWTGERPTFTVTAVGAVA